MIKQKKMYFKNSYKGFNELKNRILFVIGSILIFRLGTFILIPGINYKIFKNLIIKKNNNIINIFNIFSGGSLNKASIFSLGIMPYISSSMIIQLITTFVPKLKIIKKEGEIGTEKINKYTKYCTLLLSIFQSLIISISLFNIKNINYLILNKGILLHISIITTLTTGSLFLMWLGDRITNNGIGNGTSIIIFIGLICKLPYSILYIIKNYIFNEINYIILIILIILIFSIIYFIVFIELAQKKIIVNYAIRQQKNRIYSLQNTHLPLKINISGITPTILASSTILIIKTLYNLIIKIKYFKYINIINNLKLFKIFYLLIYLFIIIFFCFFYTKLTFNIKEISNNLKKSGAYIYRIRPGKQTSEYINTIVNKITLIGSIYIGFICLIPKFINNILNINFNFSGTSLIIIVIVIIDFINQIQTIIISNKYNNILKKSNLIHY